MANLAKRLADVKPCRDCSSSENGNWATDDRGAMVIPPKRCHCLRGRLLAVADLARAKRFAYQS